MENNTDGYLNLKDIDYQKYIKIRIMNTFLEFDQQENIQPLKNIMYNPVPCIESMINSTDYERQYWDSY